MNPQTTWIQGRLNGLNHFLPGITARACSLLMTAIFLDNIATRIVELSNGRFHSYTGNYTDYLLARAEQKKAEERNEHKRQRFLKRELQWIRKSPSARRTKSKDRIERYYEEASKDSPEEDLDIEPIIPPAPKLANRVIDLEKICCRFGERVLFENITLSLQAENEWESLAVMGLENPPYSRSF